MIDYILKLLLNTYIKYETEKLRKKAPKTEYAILPNYVMKRPIKIINNGVVVFDSKNHDSIPRDIQYTIKSYGIPQNVKPYNRTPIVYKVNTTLSSMFQNVEMEELCLNVNERT